jgi:hypothetical protein
MGLARTLDELLALRPDIAVLSEVACPAVLQKAFGAETCGTYWHHRKHPYHIDYIFVPKSWLKKLVSFEIGTFGAWCSTVLSDHAPLIAEFREDQL